MRICYISLGNFIHLSPYITFFKQAGHDVHLVALSPGPDHGVPTYNVGFGTKYSATDGKWKYPFSMFRARRIIRKLKPDIVHAHYATSCGLTALVCGYHPFVVTAHGSDVTAGIHSLIWRPLLRKIFDKADCINTVSDELTKMVRELGISAQKIETLTLGIDTQKFYFNQKQVPNENRMLRLICTRRFEDVYDHKTIITAISILKKNNIKFHATFVGGGSLKKAIEQQADCDGLSSEVEFLGEMSNSELPKALAQNDVYLSASLRDGTSLCLLEAMAAGLYPIVSRIPANTAWLDEGITGSMHAVGNSDELADAIIDAAQKPDHVAKAVKANRDRVVEKADRDKNMKKLEAIYYQLIKR